MKQSPGDRIKNPGVSGSRFECVLTTKTVTLTGDRFPRRTSSPPFTAVRFIGLGAFCATDAPRGVQKSSLRTRRPLLRTKMDLEPLWLLCRRVSGRSVAALEFSRTCPHLRSPHANENSQIVFDPIRRRGSAGGFLERPGG